MDSVTQTILRQLRATFGVSIRRIDDEDKVTLVARASNGEQWRATAEDDYRAACALAELLGFDLMDG